MNAVKNKRGNGYLATCVTVLAVFMFLSVFTTMWSSIAIVNANIDNAGRVFDSYIQTNEIAIYNSLKNGNNAIYSIDPDVYVDMSKHELCLQGESTLISYRGSDTAYEMTIPQLSFTEDDILRLRAQYQIKLPLVFFGYKVAEANVPVVLTRALSAKD